ncbi:hypothetical protein ACHAWF_018625 [Thalassiosira exigua]
MGDSSTKMTEALKRLALAARDRIQQEYYLHDERKALHYSIAYSIAVVLPVLASFALAPSTGVWTGLASLIVSLWHLSLRIVGTSLGIGLGLGLAGHVCDTLSDARDGTASGADDDDVAATGGARGRRGAGGTSPGGGPPAAAPPLLANALKSAGMEDVNSYRSLMRSAGYSVDGSALRATVVRGSKASDASAANDARRGLRSPYGGVYKFDKGTTARSKMKCMWPNLAPVVNESLAKLTEFVLRDYVACWYSKVDEGVAYEDPEEARAKAEEAKEKGPRLRGEFQRGGSTISAGSHARSVDVERPAGGSGASSAAASRSSSLPIHPAPHPSSRRKSQQQRTMVLTTAGTQASPFVDSLYSCFSYLLGMLATRASENVNVLELLLLHFPHVLAQNLRIYRQMRAGAMEKQRRRAAGEREKWRKRRGGEGGDGATASSGSESRSERGTSPTAASGTASPRVERSGSFPATLGGAVGGAGGGGFGAGGEEEGGGGVPEEIAVVREYLLAGRFHRALTFGLDVPSLLFADPRGKDCPPGPSYGGNGDVDRLNGRSDEDAVLEDRLLSEESTLIAEMSRLVVPKIEMDSAVVRTMMVEILASCVLLPVMGCFCPDTVNGWIVTGLGLLEGTEGGGAEGNASESVDAGAVGASSDLERNPSMTNDPNGNNSRIVSSPSVVSEEDDLLEGLVDDDIDDMAYEGSVSSEMEESLFGIEDETARNGKAEQIITLLSMSIMELSNFVDFEECRYAREHSQDCVIDWDAKSCRDSVRHLVLVIEAALLLGVRSNPKRQRHPDDRAFSEFEIEATLEEDPHEGVDEFEVDLDEGLVESKVKSSVYHQHASLSAALMELTGDMDSFERLVNDSEHIMGEDESLEDENEVEIVVPQPNELSTLRTLIAAWLHTGQAFKVMSIIVRAKHTILRRFYHRNAFLRRDNYAGDFTRLLRQLDGVDILVDTMAVLASQCLLLDNGFDALMKNLQKQPKAHAQKQEDIFPEMGGRRRPQPNSDVTSISVVGSVRANLSQNRDRIARFAQSAAEIDLNPFKDRRAASMKRPSGANLAYNLHQNTDSAPAYLAFSKNEVFASSLRAERERRDLSWAREIKDRKNLDFVCRTNGMKDKDIMMHRELHHLARFFYSNTNEMRIEPCSAGEEKSPSDSSAANVTIKAVGTRRKIEVPDEDSSFLLRAQQRPLKPVAIQRDHRNPSVACKVYAAFFEEPAIHPKTKRFYGGRYLRQW